MKKILIVVLLTILSSFKVINQQAEVKIDLRGKHLKSIPDSVFNNKNVVFLDLGSSNVTFYPPLSSLKDPNSNHLTFLPERIGELSNLNTLIVNTNNLTALPNSLTKLKNLEVLDLSINHELNILKELDKLKALPKLKVLKVIDVKMNRDDFTKVKDALGPKVKVIVNIREYFESMK